MEGISGPDDQFHPLQAAQAQVALQVEGLDAFGVRRAADFFEAAVVAQLIQKLLDDVLHPFLEGKAINPGSRCAHRQSWVWVLTDGALRCPEITERLSRQGVRSNRRPRAMRAWHLLNGLPEATLRGG